IHKNMLLDLTKELMKELGITVVGDVIAILRHAKVVHRQEMCRAASESLQPEAPTERGLGGSVRDRDHRDRDDREQDLRDPRALQALRDPRDPRERPCGAAERMISNSLRREPPPRSPRGISVTVPNGTGAIAARGAALPPVPCKRRRVTAEMEGKYVISLPKGTTARTRKILQLQAARAAGGPR
ncbi:uncharacterized protein C19orf47 homolog, partial [Malurus melanocephalus]|uniref:uncharacterized protein C19orf47 homolog n=1 Tax=Malurus melanocephalus TaxID=175006 RepID=UPI0025490DB9